MAEHFPSNRDKQTTGVVADNGRGMDLDSELVVALRHRSSSPPSHSPEQLQSVREAFISAPLGTIAVRDGSGSARIRDHREKDFGRKTSGVCNDGEYPQGEAPTVLDSQDQAHDSGQVHRVDSGNLEILGNSVLGGDKGEGSAKGSMEFEGYRG